MTLLEVITKASSGMHNFASRETDYPMVLNAEPSLLNLRPEIEAYESGLPLQKAVGWELSQTDTDLASSSLRFFKKLRRTLHGTAPFGKGEFLDMVSSYLVKSGKKAGVTSVFGRPGEGYACEVVEKLGFMMDNDLRGLVLEGCIKLDAWSLLECLIINGLVERRNVTNLVTNLIEKLNSELIIVSLKHLDLQSFDLLCILKYFLSFPSDGYGGLVNLRKHWEKKALSVIDKLNKKSAETGKEISTLKEAALSIMLAYDGFTGPELCLHYVLSSPNFDHVIFSASVSKLSIEEMKGLVQYLAKWIWKYEKFPQVIRCTNDSIPTLENVAKCLSMCVDEHFASFIMHDVFHELLSVSEVVASLAAEAKICSNLANLIERMRIEEQDQQQESS